MTAPRSGFVNYLKGQGLERMERPSLSTNLNLIEYLWNYLGAQVAALGSSPRPLDDQEKDLLRVCFHNILTENT